MTVRISAISTRNYFCVVIYIGTRVRHIFTFVQAGGRGEGEGEEGFSSLFETNTTSFVFAGWEKAMEI